MIWLNDYLYKVLFCLELGDWKRHPLGRIFQGCVLQLRIHHFHMKRVIWSPIIWDYTGFRSVNDIFASIFWVFFENFLYTVSHNSEYNVWIFINFDTSLEWGPQWLFRCWHIRSGRNKLWCLTLMKRMYPWSFFFSKAAQTNSMEVMNEKEGEFSFLCAGGLLRFLFP